MLDEKQDETGEEWERGRQGGTESREDTLKCFPEATRETTKKSSRIPLFCCTSVPGKRFRRE